jgi:hypothetical protein
MITVGGFGSAFDRFLEVDELRPGAVLRAEAAVVRPAARGSTSRARWRRSWRVWR